MSTGNPASAKPKPNYLLVGLIAMLVQSMIAQTSSSVLLLIGIQTTIYLALMHCILCSNVSTFTSLFVTNSCCHISFRCCPYSTQKTTLYIRQSSCASRRNPHESIRTVRHNRFANAFPLQSPVFFPASESTFAVEKKPCYNWQAIQVLVLSA